MSNIRRRARRGAETGMCDAATGNGGARRSRTDDILLAKQALYQLSYGPRESIAFEPPAWWA